LLLFDAGSLRIRAHSIRLRPFLRPRPPQFLLKRPLPLLFLVNRQRQTVPLWPVLSRQPLLFILFLFLTRSQQSNTKRQMHLP
jgi:hypothetical protein